MNKASIVMKILIIGGGAAGMSAASKAKRVDPSSEVIVYDSGNFVSYAECGLPYYLGGKFDDYGKLIHYPVKEFTEKRGIVVKTGVLIQSVDPEMNFVSFSDGSRDTFDRLIICVGAHPKIDEKFKNSGVLAIRSLDSGIEIKSKIHEKMRITVVGDGVLGMELASSFRDGGHEVMLVSHHSILFPKISKDISKSLLDDFKKKINVELNSEVLDVSKESDGYKVVTTSSSHKTGLVIFATGIEPNTAFLKNSTIDLTESGLIKTDEKMHTNIEHIYAAGDCATSRDIVTGKSSWHPLAQVSNKMGRVAGSNAVGSRMAFPGSIGTTLVKIFDYEVGFAGITFDDAIKEGFAAKKTVIKAWSRAAYYEGGSEVFIEIVYEEPSGRLLGCQIVGKDNCAWRLNSVAVAIQAKLSVEELFYTDFGYTPPFGPVWDPIVIAASQSMK